MRNLFTRSSVTKTFQINSFGFGGTNALAILDDAHSYLRLMGLEGHHRTQHQPRLSAYRLASRDLGRMAPLTETEHHSTTSRKLHTEPRKQEQEIGRIASITDSSDHTNHPASSVRVRNEAVESRTNLLVSSGPDQRGAKRLTDAYQEYITTACRNGCIQDDLVYSLAVRKTSFPLRSFAVVRNGCKTSLGAPCIQFSAPLKAMPNPRMVFVFTGQGSQYLGMGRELVRNRVFRESLEQCENCLREIGCPWSLVDLIDCASPEAFDIESPMYSQSLTSCLQIALIDLTRSIGVTPAFVLGHSSGEIAAAYASGAVSRRSAVRVAYHRGLLSSRLAAGSVGLGMIAVGTTREKVVVYLDKLKDSQMALKVQIGCFNSQNSITLTGDEEQLSMLEGWFSNDGIFSRKLRVPVAYHSRFMESISEDYAQAIQDLEVGRKSGFVPMVSTVTGDIVDPAELTSTRYWIQNLISAVEFESAISRLLTYMNKEPKRRLGGRRRAAGGLQGTCILELGPHRALYGPITDILQHHGNAASNAKYLASLIRGEDAFVAFLTMVGALHCHGFPVDILAAQGLDRHVRPTVPGLPKYPFNHELRYWADSSLDQNFRFRGAPRHVLLGSRSLDWNSHIAQWRNIMRLSELPWLEDHKIGDNIVFPAAGTLVMALEAVRQILGNNVGIRGIQIRDAIFSHAISIPQGHETVETQLTLIKPSGACKATTWAQYRLFSREEGSYIECASGWVRPVITENGHGHVSLNEPWEMDGIDSHAWFKSIEAGCRVRDSPPLDLPRGTQVRYGPAFQNLEWVRMGFCGEIIAGVNTESWKVRGTSTRSPSFAIHPTTLDGLAQCMGQALLAQRPHDLPTMVPVRISNVWVDCNAENLRQGTIQVAAKARFQGYKGCSADIVATTSASGGQKGLLLYMRGLETAFIDEKPELPIQTTGIHTPKLCRRLVWKEDIELMSCDQLLAYCTCGRPSQQGDAQANYESLAVVVHCFIQEALQSLEQNLSLGTRERFGNYITWMQHQQRRLQSGQSVPQISHELVQDLVRNPSAQRNLETHVEQNTPEGFFFIGVGRNLVRILSGELDPLDFMFRGGLADRYYEQMLANEHHEYPIWRFVELLCFKNPCMRILEVGAGTGGQTKGILDAMSRGGVKRWEQYEFTDISPSFLNHGRVKLQDHVGKISFRTLDVSLDPIAQQFEAETYDLIIASHVLHATQSLKQSLRNIRTLLKPGGRLLLCETTRPESVPIGFPWGLLKDWWAPLGYETRALHSPCVTVKQWHELLQNTGFTGVDVNIPGQADPSSQYSSILISTAKTPESQIQRPAQVYLIVKPGIESQAKLAKALVHRLDEAKAISCRIGTLADVSGSIALADNSHVILLLEVDATFLDTISRTDYECLQSVLVNSSDVLWLTRSSAAGIIEPRHHLAEGLGRALMSEDSARKFTYLSLQDVGQDNDSGREIDAIHKIFQRMMETTPEKLENSYKASQDGIKICRVSDHTALNTEITQGAVPHRLRPVCPATGIPLSLQRLPGQDNHFGWAQDTGNEAVNAGSLKRDEILVRVQAFGFNHCDKTFTEDHTNETRLGLECAGAVVEAGSNSGFQTGDRVCLISLSAAKSMIRVHASSAFKIPPDITYTEAASITVPHWLAYHAVVNSARVQKGDIVIIHDGSDCVGQMLIQLARNRGARVLVIVGTPEDEKYAYETLSVAKADVFLKDDHMSPKRLLQSTLGMGPDVWINTRFDQKEDDENLAKLLCCLAPCGRLVDIRKEMTADKRLARSIGDMAPNISYTSIYLEHLMRERPDFARKVFQDAMNTAFSEGLRGPQPLHIVSANGIGDSLCSFEDAENRGKIVVRFDQHSTLLVSQLNQKSSHGVYANLLIIRLMSKLSPPTNFRIMPRTSSVGDWEDSVEP
jgi:acyl transferase domain-containing protein/NADPH:quinone reductase-like Zn-dependent oxidoreductase/SAM-dependent methyltransferase